MNARNTCEYCGVMLHPQMGKKCPVCGTVVGKEASPWAEIIATIVLCITGLIVIAAHAHGWHQIELLFR